MSDQKAATADRSRAAEVRSDTRPAQAASPRPASGPVRLIDRYILRLAVAPMLGCLAVIMTALLLERMLRLLNLMESSRGRMGYVFALTANLAPHYLGLALPTAFFVGMFIVFTSLNDHSEVDALLAGGLSLGRLAAPFAVVGLVLAAFSLALFGYIQPYSRYAFRAITREAVTAGWDGRVTGRAVARPDDTLTLTAEGASAGGRRLDRVFIRRLTPERREEVTTAASAEIQPSPLKDTVHLVLRAGQRLLEDRKGDMDVVRFDRFELDMPVRGTGADVLPRGRADARELTLDELMRRQKTVAGRDRAEMRAEIAGRLVRSLAPLFLPFLALPLALASRRGGKGSGAVLAAAALLGFEHALQFSQGLAQKGRAPAALIWLVFAIFAALCVGLFAGGARRPGDTPAGRMLEAASLGLGALGRRLGLSAPRRTADAAP